MAFVGVTALTLLLVSAVVVNRLDDYFKDQVTTDLAGRIQTVEAFAVGTIGRSTGGLPVVALDGSLNPAARAVLRDPDNLTVLTQIAQANVQITVGRQVESVTNGPSIVPSPDGTFEASLDAAPNGRTRDNLSRTLIYAVATPFPYALRVTLSQPYTVRAETVRTIATLLAVVAIVALALAVVVADASRDLAGGDLSARVAIHASVTSSSEITTLGSQFNAMADRLQESMSIIRRDRDRSRDFLADVSHELRTPIAAMRTFVELLQGRAGGDPAARQEFLESSAQQLERLDWLAQNLLELSKLDSGLVLLDLRPEDVRAAVESAIEQAEPAAERRGLRVELSLPAGPVRVLHDPPRIGQVVSNLVGNAIKFTARGGTVSVTLTPHGDGARIVVRDTGVGIDPRELPRIFERFYRGSRANEARGSGSGLGLAIVKSIVDMHGGRIAVESHVGEGAAFTIDLASDPRAPIQEPPRDGGVAVPDPSPEITNSSPPEAARLNQGPAVLGMDAGSLVGDRLPRDIQPRTSERPS
jgi:signal transduction histidine kinase